MLDREAIVIERVLMGFHGEKLVGPEDHGQVESITEDAQNLVDDEATDGEVIGPAPYPPKIVYTLANPAADSEDFEGGSSGTSGKGCGRWAGGAGGWRQRTSEVGGRSGRTVGLASDPLR